ncbi:MAG: dephospho-CoA kinase [Acutalibacteraceae bacterium]|nr:dephospho-CoA kinase [Acutalibacteraceae bacterium]
MRNYTVIGITGPTGSGKSTITEHFKNKDCFVIDADVIGKKALESDSPCLRQACTVFGDDIIEADGKLNRQLLAKRAFSTKENTQKLNDITHPWICMQVLKTIDTIRSNNRDPIIIFDAAVLFESKMDIICDYVIAVIAPVKIRKQRIMKRDNISSENAEIRINAQMQDSFYVEKSDFVFDGSSSLDEIYKKADEVINIINKR